MERIRVIFNPVAGQGRAARAGAALQAELSRMDEGDWFRTTRRGDAYRLAAGAAREGVAAVVAAGGDGTVHEIVNGLLSVRREAPLPTLAILPLGSANDFAAGLGIRDVATGWECVRNGRSRPVDVGRVTDENGWCRYFCFSAGSASLPPWRRSAIASGAPTAIGSTSSRPCAPH